MKAAFLFLLLSLLTTNSAFSQFWRRTPPPVPVPVPVPAPIPTPRTEPSWVIAKTGIRAAEVSEDVNGMSIINPQVLIGGSWRPVEGLEQETMVALCKAFKFGEPASSDTHYNFYKEGAVFIKGKWIMRSEIPTRLISLSCLVQTAHPNQK